MHLIKSNIGAKGNMCRSFQTVGKILKLFKESIYDKECLNITALDLVYCFNYSKKTINLVKNCYSNLIFALQWSIDKKLIFSKEHYWNLLRLCRQKIDIFRNFTNSSIK